MEGQETWLVAYTTDLRNDPSNMSCDSSKVASPSHHENSKTKVQSIHGLIIKTTPCGSNLNLTWNQEFHLVVLISFFFRDFPLLFRKKRPVASTVYNVCLLPKSNQT